MKWIIAALSPLAGCTLPPLDLPPLAQKPTSYHSVAWYDLHPMERAAAKAWCGNNPGLAGKVPSCDSADVSGIHAWHRQMGWEN
jgi:hypothetical protein